MQVGLIGGTGPAGRALAARLASVGVDVIMGSRSAERAHEIVDELLGKWPDHQLRCVGAANERAVNAEIVVLATPWESAPAMAASLAEHLAGKVVISMANALIKVGDELQPLVLARGSVAAEVQASAPRAMVAAAFQHLPSRHLGDIAHPIESDVLICSDHPPATKAVADLIRQIPGLRPIDAGTLAAAAPVEAFTAVLASVNIRYRARSAVRLTGIE
ncbi:MAG: NADPH-dependent F420 reductase [Actinobacteria bacterium]|nr:MAG: NADPH-dependent F420 reductase [Actinomycetota bacterium]